jgi:hypothetical protein
VKTALADGQDHHSFKNMQEGTMTRKQSVVSMLPVVVLWGLTVGSVCWAAQAREGDTRVGAAGSADLVVVSISGPVAAFPGQNAYLTYRVKNQGSASAGGYKVGLYLSTDAVIDPSTDRLLKKVSFTAGFAAGATRNTTTTVVLPAKLGFGDYTLGAVVDVDGQVAEGDETNNAGAAPEQVAIRRFAAGDTTVEDLKTGLIWQKDYGFGTFEDASIYCPNLNQGGFSDWRVPRIDELRTIVDYSRYDRAIDSAFVCAPHGYWSNTLTAFEASLAWFIYFEDGSILPLDTSVQYWIRCVRGGPYWPLDPSEGQLQDNGGWMLDLSTGLIWQRTDGGKFRSRTKAMEYCSNLVLDGITDWRLPSIEELRTIINYQTSDPALNTEVFNLQNGWYWSKTKHAANSALTWRLLNTTGAVVSYDSTLAGPAVCVRGTMTYPGWSLHNGHSYKVIRNCGSWSNCENQAVAQGAHLVTINDQEESDWLVATFGGTENYWIGFNDRAAEGNWVWVGPGNTGKSVVYTNWAPNEPSPGFKEDCAMTNWGTPGKWNDGTCSDLRSAIIQISPE